MNYSLIDISNNQALVEKTGRDNYKYDDGIYTMVNISRENLLINLNYGRIMDVSSV